MTLLVIIAMSLQFLIAPRVEIGNEPNARDMVGLAEAANVKDRSGLGDFHYRLGDYCINWARQIRNSDELGNTPSMGEYWELYAYLNPKNDIPTYPVAGPGEPEGSNATCPPVVHQFGNDSINLPDEETRLSIVPLWYGARPAQTPEEWWIVAKAQRGVYDPATGEQNVPAIAAARSDQNVQWNVGIPHGKTTGGFFPTPVKLLDDCDDGTGDAPIPSWQIIFTALRSDVKVPPTRGSVSTNGDGRSVITYAGTCPAGTLEFGGNDVQDISRQVEYYLVFFVDGFEILSRADWLEGPYSGDGQLTRYNAEHFSRMKWAFINDFRGTDAQRNPDDFEIEKIAFDFEGFFNNQYHLAPNLGFWNGSELIAQYPQARIASTTGAAIPAKTLLTFNGQTSHIYTEGFVFTGCFAKATNLAGPVTLSVLSGAAVIATLNLSPEKPSAVAYIAEAVTPAPLMVRIESDARFTAPGEIIFEANELLSYKPDHWDAAVLLRLAATTGGDENDLAPFVDGAGNDCDRSNGIYADYLKYGCVVNVNTSGVRSIETALNENPDYEAQRRVLNSLFRMVRRQEILSYEVGSDGRPIIRVKRFAFGEKHSKADIFEGIAPSYNGVSSVVENVEYVVRSHTGGTVDYNGIRYGLNQRFVGVAGHQTFEANGDAILLEYEGIRPTAPIKGWSNEWLMSEEFHFYNPNPDSLWYPDHYADWYVRGNRCHTYAQSLAADLTRMADLPVYPGTDPTYRQLHLSPETPSGWNYALGANANASPDFCSSCQIYKAPYELASATVEFDANGNDIVKLIFKEPFQRDPSAPSSFGRDPLTWDIAALRAEPYRTTDNGLREYFYYLATGTHGSWKVGDGAYRQNGGLFGLQSLDDKPYGCIFPRLFFTSLAKKPFLDANDALDDHDTRISIDEFFKLEIKLKAWCEGVIDGFTSVQHLCASGNFPFDFTYENLKLKAFGGGTIGKGHGPVANTALDAATFNQIAACLDELYMFRLDGGMKLQFKETNYFSTTDITATWPSPPATTYACPPNAGLAAYWDGTPPTPEFSSESDWTDGGGFEASVGATIVSCGPSNSSLGIESEKVEIDYRYVPVPGFENALSPNVQDLISNRGFALLGTFTTTESIPQRHTATDPSQTGCAPSHFTPPFSDGSTGWYFDDLSIGPSVECALVTGGHLSAGLSAPGGSFSICIYADSGSPSGYSISAGGSAKRVDFSSIMPDGMAILSVPMVAQEAAT